MNNPELRTETFVNQYMDLICKMIIFEEEDPDHHLRQPSLIDKTRTLVYRWLEETSDPVFSLGEILDEDFLSPEEQRLLFESLASDTTLNESMPIPESIAVQAQILHNFSLEYKVQPTT